MSARVKLPDPLDKLLRSQLEKVIEEAAFHPECGGVSGLFRERRRMIPQISQMLEPG